VARELFSEGIYVVGFFFPVVARAPARIRTQLSAAHEQHHLDKGIEAFKEVGAKCGMWAAVHYEKALRQAPRALPAYGMRAPQRVLRTPLLYPSELRGHNVATIGGSSVPRPRTHALQVHPLGVVPASLGDV
jgi:hypothetical protein